MTRPPQKSSEYLRNFSSPYKLKQAEIPQIYNNYQSPQPTYNSINNAVSPLYPQQNNISYIPLPPSTFPFHELQSENNASLVYRSANPEFYSTNNFSQFNTNKFQTQDLPLRINNSFLERPMNDINSNINFPNRFLSPNPNERKPPLPFQEHQQNFIKKPDSFNTGIPLNPNVLDYRKPSPIYNPPPSQPINIYESPNRPINQIPFNGSIPFYRSPEGMSQNPSFIIRSNEPPMNFSSMRSINEPPMNLTSLPKIMDRQSPPLIFYHNKLNEQTKENNVFPDFITAFGTYKHYDLATRESKFRKNLTKAKTTSNIENNFIEDMSYLNVNFLQQSHYDKIYDVLKNFVFFDRNVEKLKEDLAHKSDFDIKLLFQYFDDNNTGEIVVGEWREGFSRLGISVEENDIYLMINRYSRDGNKKIE